MFTCFQNCFFLALLCANLSTTSSKSSCLAALFLMLISAKLSRRSCAIDERKYQVWLHKDDKSKTEIEGVAIKHCNLGMSNKCLNFTLTENYSLKICLELGGPFIREPPGLCPPCPPHCYATVSTYWWWVRWPGWWRKGVIGYWRSKRSGDRSSNIDWLPSPYGGWFFRNRLQTGGIILGFMLSQYVP